MELNKTQLQAVGISKKLRSVLGDRVSNTQIYDVVDEPNHHSFKIRFLAYNYFAVVFQYDLDIIGCHIVFGDGINISLIEGKHCLSDTEIDKYLLDVKKEIELRIPDKYLKDKGWI